MGQLLVGQLRHVQAVQKVLPVGRDVQTAQQIHKRGLSRAGGADDRREFPRSMVSVIPSSARTSFSCPS
ncbi:hypothetical protein SDC9_178206 [bioreactor metagenome]|uniref:Uncharacterized protein n=1 Tax=bioreactor metagenome TaxID=1076179 RepID=A0A645GVB7_9ZZZZ